jgi:hypothetical protein
LINGMADMHAGSHCRDPDQLLRDSGWSEQGGCAEKTARPPGLLGAMMPCRAPMQEVGALKPFKPPCVLILFGSCHHWNSFFLICQKTDRFSQPKGLES